MSDVGPLIAAVVPLLGLMGAGVAWIAKQMDDKDKELRKLLESEIDRLQDAIATVQLRSAERESLFFRRIHDLEGTIHRTRQDMPRTEGWPPK